MDIRDKVAIVTGAGSGIGECVVRRFAADGARHVVVVDQNEEGAVRVADEIGGTSAVIDVSDEASIRSLVDAVEQEHGSVDLFFSNAGYVTMGGLEAPVEDLQKMWAVHVLAHIYAARAVLPGMIERDYGRIVNISSVNMQGYGAGRGVTPDYDAAKAAVASFTRSCVSPSRRPLHPQSGEARCPPAANPCRSLAAAGPRLCALQHERAR